MICGKSDYECADLLVRGGTAPMFVEELICYRSGICVAGLLPKDCLCR